MKKRSLKQFPKLAEELRGKTVEFSLTMKEVKEPKLPELNDEFFKKIGVEEGGEEAFRRKFCRTWKRSWTIRLRIN